MNQNQVQRATCEAVMRALWPQSDVFREWTYEYPGFIALECEGGSVWHLGTSNGVWGGDWFSAEERPVTDYDRPERYFRTDISADCHDYARIATALFAAMCATDDGGPVGAAERRMGA